MSHLWQIKVRGYYRDSTSRDQDENGEDNFHKSSLTKFLNCLFLSLPLRLPVFDASHSIR